MNKQDFLNSLRLKLSDLPEQDVIERLNFYSEMIDDMIEEGLSEKYAVESIGSVDDIALQIISDTSNMKKDKKKDRKKSKRRLKGWEIALIIVGAPLWVPILVFLISMIFSLYSILWSVIVSLWSIFGALAGASIGGIICGIIFACTSRALAGLVIVAAGLLCAGLAIFAFFGCLYVTKGGVWLTKKTFMGIINIFREKEGA